MSFILLPAGSPSSSIDKAAVTNVVQISINEGKTHRSAGIWAASCLPALYHFQYLSPFSLSYLWYGWFQFFHHDSRLALFYHVCTYLRTERILFKQKLNKIRKLIIFYLIKIEIKLETLKRNLLDSWYTRDVNEN